MLGRKLFQHYKAKLATNKLMFPTWTSYSCRNSGEIDIAFSIGMEQGIRQNLPKKFLEFIILLTGADSNVARSAGCLGNKGVQPRFLPSPTYANYSLSYQLSSQSGRFRADWTNMSSFFHDEHMPESSYAKYLPNYASDSGWKFG